MSDRAARVWMPVAVFALTFACFAPALANDFVNWDDPDQLLRNMHYRGLGWENVRWAFTHMRALYMPLTWLSFSVDYVIWGMRPLGYHLTSVLIHSASAVVCCLLIRALLRRDDRSGWIAAGLAALVYSIHPLRVESVVWATERRDVLSGFFALLTVLLYVRAHAEGARRGRWIALSVLCYALSLLSKASTFLLPVVLVVIDAFPLKRTDWRAALLEKLPYVALAAVMLPLTWAAQAEIDALKDVPLMLRLAQPPARIAFYIWKLLLPTDLSPLYRFDREAPWMMYGVLATLPLAGLAWIAWTRRREAPAIPAALGCFALLLVPALGFPQSGGHFAGDRYTYLAAVPLSVLAAAAMLSPSESRQRAVRGGVIGALVLLALLTVQQVGVWRDSTALWTQALRCDPQNLVAHVMRATAHRDAGRTAEALSDLDHVIDSEAGKAMTLQHHLALVTRGDIRRTLGDRAGAVRDFMRAAEADPAQPEPWANLGLTYEEMGESERAIAAYEQALRGDPGWPGRSRVETSLRQLRARPK